MARARRRLCGARVERRARKRSPPRRPAASPASPLLLPAPPSGALPALVAAVGHHPSDTPLALHAAGALANLSDGSAARRSAASAALPVLIGMASVHANDPEIAGTAAAAIANITAGAAYAVSVFSAGRLVAAPLLGVLADAVS